MGVIVVDKGGDIIGCTDPKAVNYDPTATTSCVDCCIYSIFADIIGCTDPKANNYDPSATTSCADCCMYSIFSDKIGCTDRNATNYDPTATTSCVDCCMYKIFTPTDIIGCTDRNAVNYDPTATTSCANCCLYGIGGDGETNCPGPFAITDTGQVLGVNSAECCNGTVIGGGLPPEGYEYYWDGRFCYYREIVVCPTDFICLNCNNLNWWNNTYITHHGGQSLQISNPVLWNKIINLVVNSGQTFYVQTSTGNLIDSNCCSQAGGTMVDGLCSCTKPPVETYTHKCISNITEFLTLLSGPKGQQFFNTNFSNIGNSIGLTPTQVLQIITNTSNGSLTDTQSLLILSNQLIISGGFYVKFSTTTGEPVAVSNKGECDSFGGYWDGYACKCKPPVSDCVIDITQVETVSIKDFYNNTIQIVTLKDPINDTTQPVSISEQCCNKLISTYNLPWVYQSPYCLATPREDCLPVIFNLNQKPMKVPPCPNNLELSMWVYFGKPSNPCQPIPDPPEIVTIEGSFCDIILTPNGGITSPTTGGTIVGVGGLGIGTVDVNPSDLSYTISTETLGSPLGRTSGVNEIAGINPNGGNEGVTPQPSTCCYNNLNPIRARVITTDPLLNSSLIQIKEYNSVTDYFDKWIEIKAQLPMSGLTLNFGLNLEIYQGLNCCCGYDIFVDDIAVTCSKDEPALIVNNIQCPGFELNRVIDNKKSWVYNPGTAEVGISDYDIIEREDGSFGLLNGEGNINRTFAPSLDADIPWRYTDYWNQSSVLERHSNLVLNSKEFNLTFDMCGDCPISASTLSCPDGYILSAGTSVCYNITGTTSATSVINVSYLGLLELENYKKTFQSFWIPFMEQFIPATTIWVAGEKWCGEACTIIDPCDYDFELVDSDVIVQSVPAGFFPGSGPTGVAGGTVSTVPTNITSKVSGSAPSGSIPDTSGPILDGPVILIPLTDYGLVTTKPLLPTTDTLNIDFQAYQDKFTGVITITEFVSA